MKTETKDQEIPIPVDVQKGLMDQINAIVPGSHVTEIRTPGKLATVCGKLASMVARFLIWLDASIYSMFCWWGSEKVFILQTAFHVLSIPTLHYGFHLGWMASFLTILGVSVGLSLPIQFVLYSFEFSLMGKDEKKIGSFRNEVERRITDGNGTVLYPVGRYEISVYHQRPTMLRCAFFWPICLFFVVVESLAHYLLVFRDHALGNRYGSFVLLPEDWVEFYKEVPKGEYTGFIPEHFTRRLDQVLKDHQGEVFVLVPFGIMPGHLPELDTVEDAQARWSAHLADLQRPQGDPVLAVRLQDETRYGRMLVVGHWLTVATLQKFNLLFHEFDLEPKKVG